MLESLLHQEVQEKGPLSQSRFMELALQHPLYGYYRSQEAISRDFTTSPEISQLFGDLIGAWVIDCYEKLNQPQALSLIELGPGKGTLMADILRIGKLSAPFLKALKVHLVEINPLLKEAQRKVIQHPATWIEKLEEVPNSNAPLMIIGNEFFDALPTHCYARKDNVLYERCVDCEDGKLVFILMPLQKDPGPDQIWESSAAVDVVMDAICSRLLRQSGVFLCIDYGYEKGRGDSLQALYKGQPSHPLSHVGTSDLTCHVNFGHLKEIALSKGLDVLGPLPQGQFLKNLGLDLRLERLKNQNPFHKASLEAGALRLTHPQQMGELFKVMAVFPPSFIKPIGFETCI
jgi:NADH dehydrogenase [ubiquinone] 1 alpha subcomplex assembly factor 7